MAETRHWCCSTAPLTPRQWFQAETGLHQNWHRDYDPTTGRYLQADPLGLVDGPSVYGYARMSPMVYADPTGQLSWFWVPIYGTLLGAGTDLIIQLLLNQFNFQCIDWWNVVYASALGAALSSTGPGGLIFGRGGKMANKFGSFPSKPPPLNRGNFRFGWGYNAITKRGTFGPHGGKPRTPDHWHDPWFSIPPGDHNKKFGIGGGLIAGLLVGLSEDECCNQ